MDGKQLAIIVFAFGIGIALGYALPRGEAEAQPDTEIQLISDSDVAGLDGTQATTSTNAPKNRDLREKVPRPQKTSDKRSNPVESSDVAVALFRFSGRDAQGQEAGQWPAAPLGGKLMLVPAEALRAVVSGVVSSSTGRLGRVLKVRGLGDQGLFAVLEISFSARRMRLNPDRLADDVPVWVRNCASFAKNPQSSRLGERNFDQERRFEYVTLTGPFDLPAGGYVLDDQGLLVGLALPTSSPDRTNPAQALEVSAFDVKRLRIVDLDLSTYFQMYFAGSVEALLKKARNALERRQFLLAVETFRIVLDREPNLLETFRRDFLAAIHGRLEFLPLRTRARGRFSFLIQSVRDLPKEGALWFELAQAARKAREFEEALVAWERAWATSSDLVANLDDAKNVIYFDWIQLLVDGGRIDQALEVIDRSVSDTGGTAEILMLQGRLLLKQRRYLDAAAAMRDAIAMDGTLSASLDEIIARAERLAEGPGKVVIDYRPGSRAIIASVNLNGRATGDFIVDTGATTSMVPEALAQRAGLDTSNRVPRITLHTAGNKRILPFSPVESIRLGGLSVTGVSVVVGDLSGSSGYGLLGMDFLGQFHIENDSQNGRLVLTERR